MEVLSPPSCSYTSSYSASRPAGLGFRAAAALPAYPRRPAHPLSSAASPSLRRGAAALRRGIPARRPLRRPSTAISAVFERFTERAIKAVIFAQKETRALGGDMVFTQHLLLGLVAEDSSSSSPQGFLGSGITIDAARAAVRKIWPDGGAAATAAMHSTDVPFSLSTKRVFDAAVEYSRSMRCNFVAPEHIAIGLLTADDGAAAEVFKALGADMEALASAALSRLQGELAKDGRDASAAAPPKLRDRSSAAKSAKSKEKSVLGQFCADLTAMAAEGLIDPIIGRDKEVERIVQILCRRTKNNPILLGEPGVGKTAIAEGLAIRISDGDVPVFLAEKRIMSLDIGLLLAGAKERGELESRVTGLIAEVKKAGDVILFIDEVHTLIGSGTVGRGSKGSNLDIGNLLKPSLGRGELQCIASTTIDEHRLHFEKDKALARRFQPVLIEEPSQDEAVEILKGLQEKYEAHHRCRYTKDAIDAAVYLSARYIPDRQLPDKAIDLIDEAGSRARMEAYRRKKEEAVSVLTKSPEDYWQEIRAVQAMHELVMANPAEAPAGEVAEQMEEAVEVGAEDIAAVAALWSGIPVQQLTADERRVLAGLEDELRRRVVGQDHAVSAISRAVKRSRVGLADPGRPIAAMLFCGPTGVGKTELTKALAASYFGSETAMLRLDMSEYMERHTVSKLIGSPPGYVGYGEGGTLTEAVRRRPFTVVLLDEIEKAHPDIFNLLLQIFEDGHLTDSQGRQVSFKNTLIVMTSNVGSTAISKGRKSIGFLIADDGDNSSYAGMKAMVTEELKAYFRPELLNRIDEIVVFRPLEKPQMHAILDIMLEEVRGRVAAMGMKLEVTEAVREAVCEQGYDRSYGARPLRRAVTSLIEDVVSEAMLAGEFSAGDTISVDLDLATGRPAVSRSLAVHYSDAS